MYQLTTAFILAFLTIRFMDADLSHSKFTDDEKVKLRKFVGNFAGIISIQILLPIIFLESIYSNIDTRSTYLGTVVFGIIFAALTFCVGYTISRKFAKLRYERWIDIATATFGGGNRGVLLLVALFTVLELLELNVGNKDAYLSFFYAFDLGNFISFYVIISIIITKRNVHIGSNNVSTTQFSVDVARSTKSSTKSILTEFMIKMGLPAILIGVGLVGMLLTSMFGWPTDLIDFVKSTSNGRKFMLLYFALIATLINVNIKTQGGEAFFDFGFFIFVRFIMAASCLLLFHQIIPGEIDKIIFHPSSVAIIILSLCPPSSLLPAQIEKYGNSPKALEAVSSFSLLGNLLFFLLIGAITLFSVFLHL